MKFVPKIPQAGRSLKKMTRNKDRISKKVKRETLIKDVTHAGSHMQDLDKSCKKGTYLSILDMMKSPVRKVTHLATCTPELSYT